MLLGGTIGAALVARRRTFFSICQKKHSSFLRTDMPSANPSQLDSPPSGYFSIARDEGAAVNFHRFGSNGSTMFSQGDTLPYLSPLFGRFNPAMALMRLFTDGDMVFALGSNNGQRVYTTKTAPGDITGTETNPTGPDAKQVYTYTGPDAYTAFFHDLDAKQPFRGYWMLMDIVSIAIWAGVVLGINKKMKIPLPIVAFAMAIDQLDIIFLALVAYKAVKP